MAEKLGKPIPIKQFLVRVQAVASRTVRAINKDEARGYVKGLLRARNPDFEFVNTEAREVKVEA